MGKKYWIGRQRAALTMAQSATDAEVRLIHYELAGRYSIKAADSLPFLVAPAGPATEGERAVLLAPGSFQRPRPGPRARRDPDDGNRPGGDGR